MSAADAQEKLDAGASLVQVYTGLIYRGATLVSEIVNSIR
jgi:dihydroorotate dehydrogenase